MAPLSTAQGPVDARAQRDADAALAQWAKAKDGGEPERARALRRLAPCDDPRVTEALLDELDRVGMQPFAVQVLDAIGRQGNRGIDQLLDLARGDLDVKDAVRDVALDGLAAADDERAWRGLASLALKGGAPQQLRVLRLLEPAKDIAAVTQVRLRLLHEGEAELAATAWRQLAQHGYADARDAFDALLDRIGRTPPAAARAELVAGLAPIVQPEQFADLLELAACADGAVQTALQRATPALGRNEAFVRWLTATGLERGDAAQRDVAFAVLRSAPAATVQPLLAKARAELAAHPTPLLLTGLHDLLRADPAWKDDVLRHARGGDTAVRTTALALLLELGCGDAVPQAQAALEDKVWELRSAAIRYLARFRALSSIPLLIARADKETGRLADELNDALFVHTGVRVGRRAEWEAWWQKHKDGHQLPPEASVRNAGKPDNGPTVAYFGLPLRSHHATFLIDVSGSMNARIGTDRKRSRLDEAKRQLTNAIEKLGDDREFNLASYNATVHPLWNELHKAKPKARQEATERVAQFAIGGGTDIYDALEFAFRDLAVDTVYLLTDGEPTAGRFTDIGELADQVRRWNWQRQVVIHCISLGEDSKLLKRLSAESGGTYVCVR
jgi:hypothetical protein